MTREELGDLVSIAWRFGLTSRSADDLVDKLWPVLAQVWTDGWVAGHLDGYAARPSETTPIVAPNPYDEVPT